MAHMDILVAVRREHASRYFQNLSAQSDFRVTMVTDIPDALEVIADRDKHVDVLVLDNSLERVFEVVSELRQSLHARLLIDLVDEEADFAMPGQADDISTDPYVAVEDPAEQVGVAGRDHVVGGIEQRSCGAGPEAPWRRPARRCRGHRTKPRQHCWRR